LRSLLARKGLQKVCPTRLAANFLDGEIDPLVDDLVHAETPPLVADHGAVVEIGYAALQGAYGDRLDGGAEGSLVARLTGLIVGLRQGLREGRSDLSHGYGEGDEKRNRAANVGVQRSVLRSAAAPVRRLHLTI
jgi:hypothetical protein